MATSERQRTSHLLRRAGFGATSAELDRYLDLGFEASVDQLLDQAATEEGDVELPLEEMGLRPDQRGLLPAMWLYRMARTSRPLAEKMAFFWHGHFATSIEKVKNTTIMWKHYEFLRDNGLGQFNDIALGISKDPAMLVWLDNVRSKKEAPNENYARELLELFTLGLGNFTEEDVKAAARAFTGWSLQINTDAQIGDGDLTLEMRRADGELTEEERRQLKQARRTADAEFIFRSTWHDSGEKTFLGETGPLDGDDIIRIVSAQPANATLITRKLFSFFVWDSPDDATLAPFEAVYFESGGNIQETMRAILMSNEFSSEEAHRAKIKSPVEMAVGLVRDMGIDGLDGRILESLLVLGQMPFLPPHVGGWPSGTAWIGPSTLLERFNLPYRLMNGLEPSLIQTAMSTSDWALLLGIDGSMSADGVVDALVQRMLYGDIQQHERDNLLLYAEQVGLDGQALLDDSDPAMQAGLAGLVRLTTSVPAYQLN